LLTIATAVSSQLVSIAKTVAIEGAQC